VKISVALERTAIAVASLLLAIGLIALLSGFFAQRDQAGVSGATTSIGQAFPDLGHARLHIGQLTPPYNSNPATSGPHIPEPVARDETQLNDDQLLQALQAGNIVIMYGGRHPPDGLRALANSVAAPFTPALATAGQAVILARRPGTQGLIGLAWTHLIRVQRASDPRLRAFAEDLLGRGAP
jgi:Protein of unknown function (DUF3105)